MSEDALPRRRFLLGAGLAGTAIATGIAEGVAADEAATPKAALPPAQEQPFVTLTALEALHHGGRRYADPCRCAYALRQ